MREILGTAKTIRQLLHSAKYYIDYYQREFKWEEKHIRELIDDLSSSFMDDYRRDHPRSKVAKYGHYFLGSVIISHKDSRRYIVDGQQRITSITLLLIHLRNLQKNIEESKRVNIDELIFSDSYGRKSFNLDVEERKSCMDALFNQETFDEPDQSESIQNILLRYNNIEDFFPNELSDEALPFFIDWLRDNVHFVEITAYTDDDAYRIFETMNDRGLSLNPTDMLKGFLLANISESEMKNDANDLWKTRIFELNELRKDTDADFFKAWLRSQYAIDIRERKRNAIPKSFDRIGTEYHRWVRDKKDDIQLINSDDFYNFIKKDFKFYSQQYIHLINASKSLVPDFEYVLYNSHHGFTLQYMLLLAPLQPDDIEDIIKLKVKLVSKFLDILLTWRLWNSRSISYSTMQYSMFLMMKEIRSLEPEPLSIKLRELLQSEEETFSSNDQLYMHQQNKKYIHRILARIIDYIEVKSGLPSHYLEYVNEIGNQKFEVEHIWADKYERHTDEFDHSADFDQYRNRIGGLLLLPKSFNASYGKLTYGEKLPHYYGQNLLAKSLNQQCYDHNPGFMKFIHDSALAFKPYNEFKKDNFEERRKLYRQIAELIWNPDDLTVEQVVDARTV